MNANDLIESYVTDVAVQLPRKQRNDVAFELRALLNEELQAKAEDAGRGADAAMATELLRAFGRPAEVAARYRPTLTIIDPADGRSFLRATVIGLAIIWLAGLLEVLRQPIGSGWDVLQPLGQWWSGTVIPSLWWPGVGRVFRSGLVGPPPMAANLGVEATRGRSHPRQPRRHGDGARRRPVRDLRAHRSPLGVGFLLGRSSGARGL